MHLCSKCAENLVNPVNPVNNTFRPCDLCLSEHSVDPAIGGPCNPYCDTGGEPCLDLCFLKLHYLERDVELFIYFDRI